MAGTLQQAGIGWRVNVNGPLVNAEYLVEQAVALAYRLAGYALLNWADDAALLALMFC